MKGISISDGLKGEEIYRLLKTPLLCIQGLKTSYTRSQIRAPIPIFPSHNVGGVVRLILLSDISTNRFCVPSQFGNRELQVPRGWIESVTLRLYITCRILKRKKTANWCPILTFSPTAPFYLTINYRCAKKEWRFGWCPPFRLYEIQSSKLLEHQRRWRGNLARSLEYLHFPQLS